MMMKICSILKTFTMHLSGIHIKPIEERGRSTAGLPADNRDSIGTGGKGPGHMQLNMCAEENLLSIELRELRNMLLSLCLRFSASSSPLAWLSEV